MFPKFAVRVGQRPNYQSPRSPAIWNWNSSTPETKEDFVFSKTNFSRANNLSKTQIKNISVPLLHCTQSGGQHVKQLYDDHAAFVPIRPFHVSIKRNLFSSTNMWSKIFVASRPVFVIRDDRRNQPACNASLASTATVRNFVSISKVLQKLINLECSKFFRSTK